MSKAKEFLRVNEGASEESVKGAFDQLKKSVSRDLDGLLEKALKSGALDIESYDNPVILAKIIMKAALMDEADAFAIPSGANKEVKNLVKFL